jgi:hypothetical protein
MPQKIKISEMEGNRVETGGVEFTYPNGNTDWPGMFIRGDNMFAICMSLDGLRREIEKVPDNGMMKFHFSQIAYLVEEANEDVFLRPKAKDENTGDQGTA